MRTGLFLIWILLTTGWCVSAQPVCFNKLHTLQSSSSYYNAVQVREHGFMGIAATIDSNSGRQGVRTVRLNDTGDIQASGLFLFPDTTTVTYGWYKSMTTVNNNYYVSASDVVKWDTSGHVIFSKTYLLKTDSNGQTLNYVLVPKNIISNDSNVYTRAVKYDGHGHILVLSAAHTPPASNLLNPVFRFLLSKYDTAFNLIWQKDYAPLYGDYIAGGIIIEQDGYTMFGGYANRHLYYENDKNYRSRAVMMKVDTAGNLLWNYETPADSLYAPISDAIKTVDGGYIYATQGHTYDHNPLPIGTADWQAQDLLIKIDTGKQQQWLTVLDKRFGNFGEASTQKIIQLYDSSIAITIPGADSIPPLNSSGIGLYRYTKNGQILSRKAYLPPNVNINTNGIVRLYDMALAIDNGFVLVGECLNQSQGYPPPGLRSWIIKVDSNGCLGDNDPQCWKVGIAEVQKQNVAISVYPNPTHDYLHVNVNVQYNNVYIILMDITGHVLLQKPIADKETIDISMFSPGIYLYQIMSAKTKFQSGRIVKF